MFLYAIVILTTVSCNRFKVNNQEEKVLPIEQEKEIKVIEAEIRSKRKEEIDLLLMTSTGDTIFHAVFIPKVEDGYLLLKKILSSSKLTEEIENTKKAKMIEGYVDKGIRKVLTPMARELINKQDKYGRTPLKLGVEERAIETVRVCIEDDDLREIIDWNREDYRGVSPILEATLREDIEMCELLEIAGARVLYKIRILKAVEAGKRVILEYILRRVDINKYGRKKAVEIAIKRQDTDMFQLLLKHGVKVSKRLRKVGMMLFKEKEKDIYEELLGMTEIKSKEILSILMEAIDEKDKDKTGLMYAIEGKCSLEILKKIVSRMSIEEVLKKSVEGKTIESYESIHEEYLKELYKVYRKAKDGVLPKILALSYGGNIELVSKLVELGGNVNVTDKFGNTALMCAAMNGGIEVAEKLIELGANIEAVDKDGDTALMWAVYCENIEIAVKLIELGANINLVDKFENTALIRAVYCGNMKIAVKLIELGANINVVDKDGNAVIILAAKSGNVELVSKLVELGVDINLVDKDGDTALMWAVYCGNMEMAVKLIELGADTSAANRGGYTALMLAIKSGNVELISKLIVL